MKPTKCVLYCNRPAVLKEAPANANFEDALRLIEELRTKGLAVDVVDTQGMSPNELERLYFESIAPAVTKKYRVRQIFGSRRRSATLFGRGVPALVTLGPDGYVEDLVPHEQAGVVVTVCDFLNTLISAPMARTTEEPLGQDQARRGTIK